jgi:spore cortex formation protein SpoVR/YcgB (stage V sporulation)
VQHQRKPLAKSVEEVLKHLYQLWGFDIHLESVYKGQVVETYHCPANKD